MFLDILILIYWFSSLVTHWNHLGALKTADAWVSPPEILKERDGVGPEYLDF